MIDSSRQATAYFVDVVLRQLGDKTYFQFQGQRESSVLHWQNVLVQVDSFPRQSPVIDIFGVDKGLFAFATMFGVVCLAKI